MRIRQSDAMAIGALAATLLVAAPASAQMIMSSGAAGTSGQAARPGDIWTAGGQMLAPRYLAAGSGQIGLGPVFVFNATPSVPVSGIQGQVNVDYAIADGTEVFALLAPQTMIGIRSRIMQNDYGSVGWGLNYRADFYPDATPGTLTTPAALPRGLNAAPIFGGVSMSQGAELRLDAMQKLGPVNLFLAPRLEAMSIGIKPGLGIGLDLDLGRFVVGYNIVGQANVAPASKTFNSNLQLEHSVGARVVITDNIYAQADWYYLPQDDVNNSEQAAMIGVGYQWGQAASAQGGGMQMRMSQ